MLAYTLPTKVTIDGVDYNIETDFRTALLVMDIYNDRALSIEQKHLTAIEIMFTTKNADGKYVSNIPKNTYEAVVEIVKFLNLGEEQEEDDDEKYNPSVVSFKEDETLLVGAVNKVAGKEIRALDYMHWWTFVALCQEIDGESLASHVIHLRSKIANGTKKKEFDENELKFIRENPHYFKRAYEENKKRKLFEISQATGMKF